MLNGYLGNEELQTSIVWAELDGCHQCCWQLELFDGSICLPQRKQRLVLLERSNMQGLNDYGTWRLLWNQNCLLHLCSRAY